MTTIPESAYAEKPLTFFITSPQVRTESFSPESIAQLAESLIKEGQLQCVGAIETGEMLYGFRRLEAARLAKIPVLKTLIYPATITPIQRMLVNLSENLQREDVSEQDVVRRLTEMEALCPDWQRKEIAAAVHKDAGQVTRMLSVNDAIEEVRAAFFAKQITVSDVYIITRSPDQFETLRIKLRGANREELARHVKKLRKPEAEIIKGNGKIKCPLPGGKLVTVVGGATLDDALDALTEALKSVKTALSKGYNVKTAQAMWADLAGN